MANSEDQIWCSLRGANVPTSECVDGCAAPEQRPVCWLGREVRRPIPVVSGDVLIPLTEKPTASPFAQEWEFEHEVTVTDGEEIELEATLDLRSGRYSGMKQVIRKP